MIIAIVVSIALVITLTFVFLPPGETPGERKAIIVCSANDFYGTETEDSFNGGPDSSFEGDTGNWQWSGGGNSTGIVEPGSQVLRVEATGPSVMVDGQFTYNWSDIWGLEEYAYYNMTVKTNITPPLVGGSGVKIGFQWINSSDHVIRTDWSNNITNPGIWNLTITGVCNNDTGNEITQLKLLLAVQGIWSAGIDTVQFDDVKIDRWIAVNVTDPTDPNPPPSKVNSDGFPAQALQVYWVLKSHGYTDDNIFLMLYYKNDADGIIDIQVGGKANDLIDAVIDVIDDDVNASRVKRELNVSAPGSFASNIQAKDQLIIYMGDHGSNAILSDKNATFHFESDNSYITETEFFNLVSRITCVRMMINIDCCFSGNFLNQNSNIGGSWYSIPNSILISAAANVFSWYWINKNNPDGFAGSWFFHQFWDQLNQSQTVAAAFNFAINWIPAGRMTPLAGIQAPLIQDNLGISNSWSFTSVPRL